MEIAQNTPLDFIKTRAYIARHSYIEDMENKLTSFEKKMLAKDFKVHWASTEDNLTDLIYNSLPEKAYNKVCFDIPVIPENLAHIKAIKPIPLKDLENGEKEASIIITQADFAIVETGTLVLLDKGCRNCLNRVNNLFVILDISKLLSKASDLETILYLKTFYHSNNYLPSDIKLISHPYHKIDKNVIQHEGEYDKQRVEITIFLYDNGVTHIMEDKKLRDALYCIDCGNCKTVCPAYEYTKEFTPIELVRANCWEKERQNGNLFKNTMLCGNCDHACPVQIPFTDLLIKEMEMVHGKEGKSNLAKIFEKRKKLNKKSNSFSRFFFDKKMYGKNKMLHNYFKQSKDPFFNVTWLQEHAEKKDE